MKAKIFLGGALAALVLGMAACSIDEIVQSNTNEGETEYIAFKATLGHSTRATAVTSNDLHEFSVWGWNSDGLFMDHAKYVASHEYYECDDLYLWPQKGASFIALIPSVEEVGGSIYLGGEVEANDVAASDTYYSGYVAKADIDPVSGSSTINVDVPADNADQIDLCYAVAVDNDPNSYVTLNFRHALSQVVFKAKNTNNDLTVKVDGVSLCSISKTGQYTLPDVDTEPNLTGDQESTRLATGTQGTWKVGNEYKNSVFTAGMTEAKTLPADGSSETLSSNSGALFLIPQKNDGWDVENDQYQAKGGAYFRISCCIEEKGSQIWPNHEGNVEFAEVAMPVEIDWEEGYRYTYTFIFGEGAGYYPPDDSDPDLGGTPIFVPIRFTVSVDEFQNADDIEVSTDTSDYEDGSLDSPYSVSTALKLIEAGVNTADTVYVKGIISEISEISPLAEVTAGHATYYMADAIADDDEDMEQLMVFEGLSLGGVEFTSNGEIEVGDKVIVYGILDADEDETPEITESIIYSLNGYLYDPEGELIYGNDFDATVVSNNTTITESTTAYQNEKGSGIETVTYGYSSTMSVRTSASSSGYYRASGNNNIFFGNSTLEYFIIKDITLPEGETDYKLAFGGYESGSAFDHDTFKVYVSEDNVSWVQLTYKFDNGDNSSTWDWATTTFTVPEGTEKLSIYYESDAASVYRIDDVRFTVGLEAGTAIDFSTGVELEGGDKVEEPGEEEGELVYGNDFDATVVSDNTTIKDGVTCYQNEEGSGIETVTYGYSGVVSVRTSATSSGYTNASGNNNIFFGTGNNYFIIKDITLPTGETDFNLAFGAYESSTFDHDTFKVYVSEDKISWVEVSYEFPDGDKSSTWAVASTTFTVPSGTEMLSIYYEATKASVYRIDDVRFTVASEEGTAIDFATGVELDGGDQEPEEYELVGDGTLDNPYTAADANWLATSGNYTSDEVYVKGIISQIDELSTSYGNATYYISDDGTTDGQFEIYRGYSLGGQKFTSEDEIKVGDEVVVCGQITLFGSTAEMATGSSIYSLNGQTYEAPDTGDLEGDGTVDNPYSASEALAIINAGTYTSSNVYVSGIISQIDEIDTSYGNATYYISDDGTTASQLEVYRGYSLGGVRFTSSDEIKVGDEVVVYGQLTMFYSTPEITTGSSIYSLNGQTYEAPEVGGTTGSGTLDDPYTASDAISIIANDSSYDQKVYITGTVSQIGTLNSSYHELNYYISDDGTTTNQLYVYCGYGLNGEAIYSTDYLSVGDVVVIYGELKVYNGGAEVNYGSTIISINGSTTGGDSGDTGGDTGGDSGDNEGKYYVKVTEELADWTGTYLIVHESDGAALNGALTTFDTSGNFVTVSISNGKIAYDSTSSACQFTIEPYGSGYSVKGATRYIYHSGSNNNSSSSTSAQENTVYYDSSNSRSVIQQPDSEYMLMYNTNWSGSSGFRYYKGTQDSIQLYKLED